MTNEINGRTPEEIKRGLECCNYDFIPPATTSRCHLCPFDTGDENPQCSDILHNAVLAYIQQLEAERDQYKRGRDAALNALYKVNGVLHSNGWIGTTLCMCELRNTINDGFIDVLCAEYEGEEVE